MHIPHQATEAAALALDEFWGGRYTPNAVDELAEEMTVVLRAALPHILRSAAIKAREENEHIVEGDGAYSSGFHYALAWIEGDPENPTP